MTSKEIHVRMGEIKLARRGTSLHAILGSCVGIGFLWKKRSKCGLAHCVLPQAPKKSFKIDGRYVDQAIHSLIAMMRIRSEDFDDIQVLLAGGGDMTIKGKGKKEMKVGAANIGAAVTLLNELGLSVILNEVGGYQGRKIAIFCPDEYTVSPIPRLSEGEFCNE